MDMEPMDLALRIPAYRREKLTVEQGEYKVVFHTNGRVTVEGVIVGHWRRYKPPSRDWVFLPVDRKTRNRQQHRYELRDDAIATYRRIRPSLPLIFS
jgi:hypothetical protein